MEDKQKEKDTTINVFDEEKAPCKTCFWALLTGYSKFYCSKYNQKPRNVYYEGAECVQYQKTDLEIKR